MNDTKAIRADHDKSGAVLMFQYHIPNPNAIRGALALDTGRASVETCYITVERAEDRFVGINPLFNLLVDILLDIAKDWKALLPDPAYWEELSDQFYQSYTEKRENNQL